ncbi:MAG: HD domain-containing protein [Candidatus Thorarchaeota archaeon]
MEQNDLENISKAFIFAIKAHEGQERSPGIPYVIHPLRVALHSLHLGFTAEAVIAAVLHDVVEDTKETIETIRELFGEDVAEIVATLTKPNRGAPNRNQIYLKQLLDGSAIACRIKLLDIQDNLSGIDEHFSPETAKVYRASRMRLAESLRERLKQ